MGQPTPRPPAGAITPGPRQRAPGSGGRTDGLRTARRAGRGGRCSEMATGVVVGSAVILAPASSPPVAPPSIECLESEGSRRQTPHRPQSSCWRRRCVFLGEPQARRGRFVKLTGRDHRRTSADFIQRVEAWRERRRPPAWLCSGARSSRRLSASEYCPAEPLRPVSPARPRVRSRRDGATALRRCLAPGIRRLQQKRLRLFQAARRHSVRRRRSEVRFPSSTVATKAT